MLLIRKMIIIKCSKTRSNGSLASGWKLSLRKAPEAKDMAGDGFRPTISGRHRGKGMKKMLIALMVGIVWLPLSAAAQRFTDPYTEGDGIRVEGHWVTPKDRWTNEFSRPGTIDPFTGQFNRYGGRKRDFSSNPAPAFRNSFVVPGSSAPNPYAIPGSSAPNPYAIPGSGSRYSKDVWIPALGATNEIGPEQFIGTWTVRTPAGLSGSGFFALCFRSGRLGLIPVDWGNGR